MIEDTRTLVGHNNNSLMTNIFGPRKLYLLKYGGVCTPLSKKVVRC